MKKLLKVFISTLLCITACTAACCLGGCADGVDTHRHKPTKVAAKAPTCTEDGNNAYYTCGGCNLVFADGACLFITTVEAQTLPKTQHSYDQSAWGYIGSDGHAHTCVCGDKEGVIPHASSAPATEDSPETCTACG